MTRLEKQIGEAQKAAALASRRLRAIAKEHRKAAARHGGLSGRFMIDLAVFAETIAKYLDGMAPKKRRGRK